MKRNFDRLDHVIGDDLLQEIDSKINIAINRIKASGIYKDESTAIKFARRYILAELIEQFASWHKKCDCLPHHIQLGKGSEVFVSVIPDKQIKG